MRLSLLVALMVLPICAVATDCTPTPGRTVGTHYDIGKSTHQPGNLGEGLLIHGRFLSAADCSPLARYLPLH
jgi:hypothetical protein